MIGFAPYADGRAPTLLLLGAHCDDIEIGCGATVMQYIERHPGAKIVWVTFSSDEQRAAETRAAAARMLAGAGDVELRIEAFRESYFPHRGEALKDCFETLKPCAPDLIFTHYRHDLHQDHRAINELTWNTFRNHAILEYEIPKYDGDLGTPNTFVPLPRTLVERKCDILLECFQSQRRRHWFDRDTFMALARLRGVECHAAEGYAEAFHSRKICLAIG